ncbi:MAG: ATP-grasp domain-containing protein [Bacteroidota bacterium]
MKNLAIIGHAATQRQLLIKAQHLDVEIYLFGERDDKDTQEMAHFYFPIDEWEKETILEICQKRKIDGIISLGSDTATTTVNYVAHHMGLAGNGLLADSRCTNKIELRKALSNAGMFNPHFEEFDTPSFDAKPFRFPVMVKPADASGSKGVQLVEYPGLVNRAINQALKWSETGKVIVEDFVPGRELTVEMISYSGRHRPLTITDKITTGAPHFVEVEHHQPADIGRKLEKKVFEYVQKALDVVGITNGASHTEVILTPDQQIHIVEVSGRIGGELIGTNTVMNSTGFDYVKAVIEVALNQFNPINYKFRAKGYAGAQYVLPKHGRIRRILINTDYRPYIKKVIPMLKEGDMVHEVIDEAQKRAGVILYAHPERKPHIIKESILKFETV